MDYQSLLKLATYVVHYMPNGWRVDRRPVEKDRQHQGVKILGEHHKAIRFYQSYQTKGKVTICGEYPGFGLNWQQRRHACLPHSRASINVSPNRNPCHIAADIMRRLIPDYEAKLLQAEEAAQRYKTAIKEIEQVEHVLHCVMPDLRNYGDNSHNTSRRYHIYKPDSSDCFRSAELQTSGYGGLSCDMELRDVSIDKTIQILALLRE